jgi:putative ABC transport system permease protein
MVLFEILRIAIRALFRNKTRSFLTALGIIIGVAAVIAMVAIGEGAKAAVEEAFASMGTNMLMLLPGTTNSGGAHGGFGSMPTLTWDDLRAIQNEVPAVRYAAPVLRSQNQIMSEEQNWTTSIQGTSPEYLLIRNWKVAQGEAFTAADDEAGNKVVLIGKTVADKLFGANAEPVNQVVRIRNIPFVVMGVLAEKGQSPMGQDYDDVALVPVRTYQAKVQGGLSKFLNGVVMIGATSAQTTGRAETQISSLLRERHRIPEGGDDDFSIRNLAEMMSAQEQGTKTLTALLASIAAVSLLVGGIGIMNIMLVSVTERTREIGVRMAIGAKPNDILLQFLVEALTLSVTGGVIGVGLGLFVGERLATQFHWPLLIRPEVVLVAVLFSAAVGIGFGLYPARKASRLDPIEALRYE